MTNNYNQITIVQHLINMLPHTQFQHTRIEKLCQNNFFAREQKFPTDQDRLTEFYSHLLFDDQKKIIFCFVPKVCVCVCDLVAIFDG